jgi:hypothetical protein
MKKSANLHLAVNLGAVVLFAINLWLRFRLPTESYVPMGMSVAGVLALGVGAWLGGEMFYVKRMAGGPMISQPFLPTSRPLRPGGLTLSTWKVRVDVKRCFNS